jgi:hypothetical protein
MQELVHCDAHPDPMIFDLLLTLNDGEVCIALFNGTLVNNQTTVQQQTYDITIHSVPIAAAPGGLYLKFSGATGGTQVLLRWDTPGTNLLYFVNANGANSTLQIATDPAFSIPGTSCPSDPVALVAGDASQWSSARV